MVARLGGEEFAIYMPDTDIATAQLVAERIRRQIFNSPLVIEGLEIPLSTSIGISLRRPGEQVEDALKRADTALYQAKAKGRNRVSVAGPPALKPSAAPSAEATLHCTPGAAAARRRRRRRRRHDNSVQSPDRQNLLFTYLCKAILFSEPRFR